jgi:hypothetical protein
MAKRNTSNDTTTAVQRVGQSPLAARPDFLTDAPVVGTEALKEYVVLPRFKVVQKQAGPDLLAKYGPGDLITSPSQVLVAEMGRSDGRNADKEGAPLYFVPIFFFTDWVTQNPIERKDQLPMIHYRTADPNDPIVAKSRDKNLRQEPLILGDGKQDTHNGKPLFRRHVEQLNWIIMPQGSEAIQDPIVLVHAKGDHFAGRNFAGLVRMRKASPFACIFELHTAYRPPRGAGQDWYGIDVRNPAEGAPFGPWVTDKNAYSQYEAAHLEFVELYKTRGVKADDTDIDAEVVDSETVDTANREM